MERLFPTETVGSSPWKKLLEFYEFYMESVDENQVFYHEKWGNV